MVVWPVQRDGGAMLNREVSLKDLTNKQSGNLHKWHPYNEERKPQFGDVPDTFVETSHYSVFNEAEKDLVHFGRAATTWDFWQSMAVIGGVSLASAVVDKPLDNKVAKHVNKGNKGGGRRTRITSRQRLFLLTVFSCDLGYRRVPCERPPLPITCWRIMQWKSDHCLPLSLLNTKPQKTRSTKQ